MTNRHIFRPPWTMHHRASSCPPPPTKNALSHDERFRLIRSSRKLKTLLGETPHFVEHLPRPEIGHTALATRPHSPCSVQRPPMVVVHTLRQSSPPVTRPLLLLRVRSDSNCPPPRDHHRHRHARSASQTPLAPSFAPLLLDAALNMGPSFSSLMAASRPLSFVPSPNPSEPSDSTRRKKTNRVARTLGHSVPPELVFSHPPTPPHPRGRRPISPPSRNSGSPRSFLDLEHNDFTASVSVIVPYAFRLRSASASTYQRRSSTDLSASSRPRAESASIPLEFQRPAMTRARRTEACWTGEWNESMEEVIKRLRELKG